MAETLLWRAYTEQRGLTYTYQSSYGASLIVLLSLGIVAATFKAVAVANRMRLGTKWVYPWSPGNLVVIIGILIHDLPFSFIIYFFYIKYYSVLSAFQLTLMVFQAANLTLALKYLRLQREANKNLRRTGDIWAGNVLTALFFLTVLTTMVLMFARTVALQVGRMGMLNPDKTVAHATLKYFTPYYKNIDDILDRNCFETHKTDSLLLNYPTPFSAGCLNSVEVGIIVMVVISILTGLVQLTLYSFKFYRNLTSREYKPENKVASNTSVASSRDNHVTLKKHTFDESTA